MGCSVCKKNQRASEKHPRYEVAEAIRKPKENQATALITVEDLDCIYNTIKDTEGESH